MIRLAASRMWRVPFLLVSLVFAASVAAAQVFPPVDPADRGMSPERLDSLSARLQRFVDEGQLSGAVLLIARDGGLVYHEAFGMRDIASGDTMAVDDLFRIASQTKALVSVAIMMLQERGRLVIDEPLGKYLPEFMQTTVAVPREGGGYDVVPAERPITIRDLLTHTAGIGYGGGVAADRWREAGIQGWYFADRDEPIAETVSRMASLPMEAQPGTAFVYGYSTDILGVVVEKVSGMTLDQFLRTQILDPLGMFDTHFYVPREKADRLTTVYSWEDGTINPAPNPGGMVGQGAYLNGPRVSFSGGAGLVSTAEDYGLFLQMLANGGQLGGVRILSPTTVHLMTRNHIGDITFRPGSGFGLGFEVVLDVGARGAPSSVGEFGWGGAYHSTYWVDPVEGLVVVYLTQMIPPAPVDDHGVLRAMIYGAIEE
ncbi:MAG TPA: serine hydrolase domain-containing protein [Rhodothermales bacterium]